MQPFHLAIPVRDLHETREFYVQRLGCSVGRATDGWIDFELFGHQISAHLRPEVAAAQPCAGLVDGDAVPVPHFGVVLQWEAWHALADRLRAATTEFCLEPRIRFEGEVGEQATMFLFDPSGNALEFKALRDPAALFAG